MISFSLSPGRRIAYGACAAAWLAAVAVSAAHAQGGGVSNAMQGFSQNRDQPIQIEAASLEVRDKKKEAVFSGKVRVVQGDTTMTSKSLVVFYDQGSSPAEQPAAPKQKGAKAAPGAPMQAAAPGPTGSSSIKRLEARSNVVVTQKDQVVTGDLAAVDDLEPVGHQRAVQELDVDTLVRRHLALVDVHRRLRELRLVAGG